MICEFKLCKFRKNTLVVYTSLHAWKAHALYTIAQKDGILIQHKEKDFFKARIKVLHHSINMYTEHATKRNVTQICIL
jgi:hypothetical protein